jgi:hypothetical protein
MVHDIGFQSSYFKVNPDQRSDKVERLNTMNEADYNNRNYSAHIEGNHQQVSLSEFPPEIRIPLSDNPLFMAAIFWIVPISSLLLIGLFKSLKRRRQLHREFYRLNRVANFERLLKLHSKKNNY